MNDTMNSTTNADNNTTINTNPNSSFKVPAVLSVSVTASAAAGIDESVSSTKCELSQTSVTSMNEDMDENNASLVVNNYREETDSGSAVGKIENVKVDGGHHKVEEEKEVAKVEPKRIDVSETNAVLIGEQPPVESLNVKQVIIISPLLKKSLIH